MNDITTNHSDIKYFLYARKSSEAEDRQVASIDSQIDELKKIAERAHLKIIEILTESKSAKSPGRPVFNKMIERINKGEATGIICWKLDRLARNPIDGGSISWLLQSDIIKHIQTFERSYFPTDNVLVMSVELGMANQFIRDLSLNTKRGLRAKAKEGWLPGKAPIGYLNENFKEKGTNFIVPDPERFPIIRKIWDTLLENQYSVNKIYQYATNELGLRKPNGNKFSNSKFYEILTNPFYYGYFEYKGELLQGKHKPMITIGEFDRAQVILGNKRKPRTQTHSFAFTGLIRCGECGAMITAEDKVKHQKNGNTHNYTYYRCTKRTNPDCPQKSITVIELEKQIHELLQNIEIPPEFHRWAIEYLKKEHQDRMEVKTTILHSQRKAYDLCLRKRANLTDMRLGNEISEEEFASKKLELSLENKRLLELINDTDKRIDNWLDDAEKIFTFAEQAKKRFETGSIEVKRQILSCLGSNLSLKDGKLRIDIRKPLLPIKKLAPEVQALHARLEPLPTATRYDTYKEHYAQNEAWGG